MAQIEVITQENFEQEVLRAQQPVLVDFWAAWCGPCKMLAPVIAQIAEKYAGRIKVCKVDVDAQPQLAARYQIASIPTVMLFQNGQVAGTCVGYCPQEQLERMLP